MRKHVINGLLLIITLTSASYLLTWSHWHPVPPPKRAPQPQQQSAVPGNPHGSEAGVQDEQERIFEREQAERDRLGLPP